MMEVSVRIYPRSTLIIALALALGACSSSNGGNAVPSAASSQSASNNQSVEQVLDSAPEVTNGHMVFHKEAIHPDAGAPATLMNFLANGPNQGGVPCINCVSSASTQDNVGMTGPLNYVAKNFVWQYGISFSDLSYKGKCKVAFAIMAGKTTIDSFSATLDLKTDGGFVLYAIARNRPSYSGAATETGKYTCGKNTGSLQVPLQFA
jgi:hypothetical protein